MLDDTVLQRPAGTSIHLVSVLVPLALLGLAAWRPHAVSALVAGLFGIATGLDAIYYTRELGLHSDDVTGWLAVAAGLGLLALGAVTLWQTRRRDRWRYPRRALLAAGAFVVFSASIFPAAIAYVQTHTARAQVPANHLGVPYENVSFKATDGLTLDGWYVPSRNGAAVISFPGRAGTQRQARMLARHGYGVLLFDRRGEGRSDGQPNAWGWDNDKDLKGAIAFLQHRPDVDPRRIGGIGLSVGGEMMLQTAAETKALAAVVSEGAGARTAAEEGGGVLSRISYTFRDAAAVISTGDTPPQNLKTLVPRIAPRPVLLIAAPNSPNGERLNRDYAGHTAALWEIPESKHIGGIEARPQEYERRVISFFDRAL